MIWMAFRVVMLFCSTFFFLCRRRRSGWSSPAWGLSHEGLNVSKPNTRFTSR